MRRAGALALTVTVAVMLTGCVPEAGSDGWSRPELPESLPLFTAASTLPFDAYKLGRAEREQMQRGTIELLKECVGEYGLSATLAGDYVKQVPDDGSPLVAFQWGGRLGTLTERQASEYGYSAPPDAAWQNGSGIYLASSANLFLVPPADAVEDARINGVLYGADQALVRGEGGAETKLSPDQVPRDAAGELPPDGGCQRTVDEMIGVSLVDLSDIEGDVYGLTFNDDRVQEVTSRWASCMNDAGYDYKRVDDSVNSNGGSVTPSSISAAVADVQCTEKSRWPDTFYFVLADYQQQAIQKQPELFQSALTAERERLDAVNRLAG